MKYEKKAARMSFNFTETEKILAFTSLSLVEGGVISGLLSIYYIFALSNLEKYKGGIFALGGIFYWLGVIYFIYIPLSKYCVSSILRSQSNDSLGNFFLISLIPPIVVTFYWVFKVSKKQKEIRKKIMHREGGS